MKARLKKLSAALSAVLLVLLCSVSTLHAAEVLENGVKAALTTDKQEYKAGDTIKARVTVDNENTFAIKDVSVKITLPEGYASTSSYEEEFDSLDGNNDGCEVKAEFKLKTDTRDDGSDDGANDNAGSNTTSTEAKKENATANATGDDTNLVLWMVLLAAVVALAAVGFYRYKKFGKLLGICLVLTAALLMQNGAVTVSAETVTEKITVTEKVKIDGKEVEVKAEITYSYDDEDVETADAPSENGYYVIWDDFTFGLTDRNDETMFSSWDIALPTGTATKGGDGATFADSSAYASAEVLRAFNRVSADFDLEFGMKIVGSEIKDTTVELKDADSVAVRLLVKDGKVYANDVELCELTDAVAHYKLHVSPENGTFTISVDGVTLMDGDAAKQIAFVEECDGVDRFYIETGKEDKAIVSIETLRLYVEYYVNEKFLDGTNGKVNDTWKVTGDVTTVYKQGTQGPDNYSALLKGAASMEKSVSSKQDGAWVEFQMLSQNDAELVMVLTDKDGNTFRVVNKEGAFGYYNGNEFVKLYDCVANLWYHVMLKQTTDGTELYLNHKLKAENLTNLKFVNIKFETKSGEAYLDDIVVKDWIPLPDDYVPEPVVTEKEEGAKLVGLQSCNLWVEGEHFGYDWLTDWEERKPVLGYYDEITPEAADWELKFKIEHGIDFELYCWYRPMSGNNEPIKMARNARALHEGYMNAEYSDKMKFAITWESGSTVAGLDDFKENVIPYWIEQYFKDDRYLVIDNMPVVGMYNINNLKSYFGGSISGVKDALDALREACKEAGFDGAYVIMSNSSTASAVEISQAGFDGQYAYSWGSASNVITTQTSGMESMQNALVDAGEGKNGVVPTATMGFWDRAWNRNDGNYCSPENFKKVLEWINDFMDNTLDQDSIGSKMLLLDNWNEYGEGHFIMPSSGFGFEYLDAVGEVYGYSKDADDSHESLDITPTDEQLARINHMYIQDRHVVLVDKENNVGNLEVMKEWTFDTEDDWEGWTVGINDGKWIKDLKSSYVKDGYLYGQTYTASELAEKYDIAGATADPSIMSPDDLNLNAGEAIAIRVRMRAKGGADAVGKPALYFITEEDQKYTGSKVSQVSYDTTADGYVDLTFYLNNNTLWDGTIKQFRLDPIERDGEFWIDSIQVLKRKESGEAEVYLDGKRVYTDNPVEKMDDTYMFAAKELASLVDVYVGTNMDETSLYVYGNDVLFEFPYDGGEMYINGVRKESVGMKVVDGVIYVPFVDIIENLGTTTSTTGEEFPLYTVKVTPATAEAKAKVEINKYVDKTILKAYYFDSSVDGWTYGGGNVTKQPAIDGKSSLTATANGSNAKLWSPESAHFNVSLKEADHVRLKVKTDAESTATLSIDLFADGTSAKYTYTEKLTGTPDENGFYTITLDLGKASTFAKAEELDRACIWWYTEGAGESQTIYLDSFEILDLEANEEEVVEKAVVEVSPYTIYDWSFDKTLQNWCNGGYTSVSWDNGAMKISSVQRPDNGNCDMRVWSCVQNGDKTIKDPIGIPASDATHVLVRVNSEAELAGMALDVAFAGEDGLENATLTYEATYTKDSTGMYVALIDLTQAEKYAEQGKLSRLCLHPMGRTGVTADQTVYVESVEILNKNCDIAFASSYFKSSIDGWVQGGTTGMTAKNSALVVTPPSAAGDYNPRVWSNNGSESKVYNYTQDDATHVRIRVKAELPETLPETMTDEEKAALEQITSAEMSVILGFSDGSTKTLSAQAYPIDGEGYTTLTFDMREAWPEGATLSRISINPFKGGNEYLCKADVKVYFDSVQFLKYSTADDTAVKVLIIGNSITQHSPNHSYGWAGDWGMAATSADKDYVHLLTAKLTEKNADVEVKAVNIAEYEKYFYNWDKITDKKDAYADWDADIIIATFGANVKNGSNENDSSFENDYTFTTEQYKKIIDKFNPYGDAKVVAGATVLTNAQIVKVIKDAAAAYGYTYVDMTAYTADEYLAKPYADEILAYYQKVTGDTTNVTEVYSGVLGHPGDKGMEMIANDLWNALEKTDWIPKKETTTPDPEPTPTPDPTPSVTGNDEGKYTADSTVYTSAAYTDYFSEDLKTWGVGGKTKLEISDGMMNLTAGDTGGPRTWYGDTAASKKTIDGAFDTIRVRLKAEPSKTYTFVLYLRTATYTGSELCTRTNYTTDENGWAIVEMDVTDLATKMNGEVLQKIGMYPIGTSSVEGDTVSLDYIELLKAAPTNVIRKFTFDSNVEKWQTGGLSGYFENGAIRLDYTGSTNTGAGWKSPVESENLLKLDPSEVKGVVATVVVAEGVTPKQAKLICYAGSHATEKLSVTAEYQAVADKANTYTLTFDLSTMAASFAEGELLQSVRLNAMNILEEGVTQGVYYLDQVEFVRSLD